MSEREYKPAGDQWVRDQIAEIEAAGDTRVVGIESMGIVVVDIKGAKSGIWRRVPLMRVEHDGVYAIVASKGGAPEHPVWYRNIVANPDVDLQDGTEHSERRAREIHGEERELWWDRAVAAYPPYAEYQTKTDRLIPVLLLEPR